jgi:protein tyrosine kinase modulator
MERNVSELKVRAAQEAARAPEQRPLEKAPSLAEQARQKRTRDLQSDLDAIDRQLVANQTEETRLKSLLEEYQRKIDAVPGRESDLVELTRDYDTLKKGYDSLLTKREDSKLAANLERRQIGEQFRILDPASLPVRPANQLQRLGLSFAGAALGVILGLLVAGFLEYRNTSFSGEDEVLRVLDLPVLAVVPTMSSAIERRQRLQKRIVVDAVAVTVLAASATVLVRWALQQL